MRKRSKSDPGFRERFIHYISHIVEECIPATPTSLHHNLDVESSEQNGGRVSQPFIDPNDERFDAAMN